MMMNTAIRAARIAGMIGAVLWSIGDILLVGGTADPADYPLLSKTYASHISFGALPLMLGLSEYRLALGALLNNLAIPLYLAGSWHLYQGARPAGRLLSLTVLILLMCGNAWSPLGHAGFYYVGRVYQTISIVPPAAHDALLGLGDEFNHMLLIAWLLPVLTLGCGMLVLCLTIATGKSAYPRWSALIFNPAVPLLIAAAGSVLPAPVGTWFYAAVLNVAFLLIYTSSTALLWRTPAIR
ncbi:DUF6796 family protein [Novosphingobium guangzhouense]|uniref:DUF998 domain-containing protein n=1 Tax=Novosphingobium guangzhouense TaxID=1850347 RepID=A0A2K2FV88_9SPHN|nr:hypothetical protein A8V01_25865 [Novosphingobium guangzhouense]